MTKIPATKDLFYVGFQLVFFLMYFLPVSDLKFESPDVLKGISWLIFVLGLFIFFLAILQLNKNLTPFPSPVKTGKLIQTGLYKYARHPIYSGLFLMAIGYGIYSGSFWKIGIGFLLLLLFYFKSRYEEKLLLEHYPEYPIYKTKTKRFFPYF